MSGATMISLTCKHGHVSEHRLDAVLRRNDAWCGKCGADLPYAAPAKAPEAEAPTPIRRETAKAA
jgi:hypothetical protein